MNGGDLIAEVLVKQGVRFLFTLCGGHISPILVGAKARDIRVVDVRDEASAVFAADAVSRLSGIPGVAAVTAGPGVTNAITAVKNAQLAQSSLVLLGGATATMLKGRGALQDIDQLALLAPHVKWLASVKRVRSLVPVVEKAFRIAQDGVPGPVFIECPVDLLYDEDVIRGWFDAAGNDRDSTTFRERLRRWYMHRHLDRLFADSADHVPSEPAPPVRREPDARQVARVSQYLEQTKQPVCLVGSQAMLMPHDAKRLAAALDRLGVPVYLSGMARGLLGAEHPLQLRHLRKQALQEADLTMLVGVPCDFRLGYGRHISQTATLISVNRSGEELKKNRRPTVAIAANPALFVDALAEAAPSVKGHTATWLARLRSRDRKRQEEIARRSIERNEYVNPLLLCRAIDRALDDDSVQVLDGGDFVATASYITRPRTALSSLDPGVFGTLGVGAGFALGAKLCRPTAEVWILYGDGAVAFSLAEFDTFVRHGLPVIAVVGNDGGWTQIAREQTTILKDDVGTVLRRTDYERVAEGYGGTGLRIERAAEVDEVLAQAKSVARGGSPVLVNALIGKTDFRAGSISI